MKTYGFQTFPFSLIKNVKPRHSERLGIFSYKRLRRVPPCFAGRNSTKGLMALIIIGLAAYANTISHPFVHDDLVFIRHNPQIANLSNLSSLFLQTTSPSYNLPMTNPYYRPLLEILYRLQYQLFHFQAAGYHVFNILVHVANSLLIFQLIKHLIQRPSMAWTIAAFFLIHPVQTEAVACISGVSNLLFTLLSLTSFLFYIKAKDSPGGRRVFLFYGGALLAYVSALFIKEQAVVLPVLLILYEACFGRARFVPAAPGRSAQHSRSLTPLHLGGFIIVTLLYLLWRRIFLGGILVPLFDYPYELFLRIRAIPRTLLMYFRVLLWPWDLHYYRSIDVLQPVGLAPFLCVALFAGIMGVTRLLDRASSRLVVFGWGWFFITILPALNIIPLINEYSLTAAFEHFLYLPMVGFFCFFIVMGDHVFNRFLRGRSVYVKKIVVSLLVAICVILTVKQNTYWQGEIPLFERVAQFENRFARGHVLLGKAYYFDRQYDKAIRELQTALNIMQGYAKKTQTQQVGRFYLGFLKGIHFDMAHCYEGLGHFPEAIEQYRQALTYAPKDGVIHNNIGTGYIRLGQIDRAIFHLKEAMAINAGDLMAKNNLAICYTEMGNYKEAGRLWQEILQQDPHFVSARQNLERLKLRQPSSVR